MKTTDTAQSAPPLPKLSIIIPTYNCAQYITEALKSVFQQDYSSYEVIVVDDGSTDNTRQVLTLYFDKIRYVYQENAGPAVARNHGLRLAYGEFIGFLDADDFFLPGKLTEQMAIFEQEPMVDAVHSGKRIVRQNRERVSDIEPWQWCVPLNLKNILLYLPICLGSLIVRRTWVEKIGGFDPHLRQAEDANFFLQLALAGCRFVWLPTVTVAYRLHQTNITRKSPTALKYRNIVLNAFFSRPDIPENIAALKSEVKYNALLWASWHLFYAGFPDDMTVILQEMIADIPGQLPVNTLLTWLSCFAEWHSQYGGQREELKALRPYWRRIVVYEEELWNRLERLFDWWLLQGSSQNQELTTLSNLWAYIEILESQGCPNIPLEAFLDEIVEIWHCYFEIPKMQCPLQKFHVLQSIPTHILVCILQRSISIRSQLITASQVYRFWGDLRQAGVVRKAEAHEVVSLYLTVFGQAVVKHRQWRVALLALKEALKNSDSCQALSGWYRFFKNVAHYIEQGVKG